jgi:DNA-binding CsgD family transcriptional regulator
MFTLGLAAEDRGDYARAEALFTTARLILIQTGERWRELATDYHLGIVALGQGNSVRATMVLESAIAAAVAHGDRFILPAWCQKFLALIACDDGDVTRVAQLLRRLRQFDIRPGKVPTVWRDCIETAAILAALLGDQDSVSRLLGALALMFHDKPIALPEGAYFSRLADAARERLGDDAYQAAWNAGRRMSHVDLQAEMDRLLTAADLVSLPAPTGEDNSHLTPREREVLRLLVDGRSNREIAGALFISHRTATTHVTNILAKLGVETRAAAVTYAFRHELL